MAATFVMLYISPKPPAHMVVGPATVGLDNKPRTHCTLRNDGPQPLAACTPI